MVISPHHENDKQYRLGEPQYIAQRKMYSCGAQHNHSLSFHIGESNPKKNHCRESVTVTKYLYDATFGQPTKPPTVVKPKVSSKRFPNKPPLLNVDKKTGLEGRRRKNEQRKRGGKKSSREEEEERNFEANCIAKYADVELINDGVLAAVYSCSDGANTPKLAVKVSKGDSNKDLRRMMNEVRCMLALKHDNIVELFNFNFSYTQCYFVMEYAAGDDLRERYRCGIPNESFGRHIFKQIFAALSYLHASDEKLVHHDIKPENILLMSHKCRPVAKLTDFGLSRAVHETQRLKRAVGTPKYMAPEMLKLQYRSDAYRETPLLNEKVDIYAAGISLLQVFHLKSPGNPEVRSMIMAIREGKTEGYIRKRYFHEQELKSANSREFVSFFYRCVTIDQCSRPSADDLLKDPWITGTDRPYDDCGLSANTYSAHRGLNEKPCGLSQEMENLRV